MIIEETLALKKKRTKSLYFLEILVASVHFLLCGLMLLWELMMFCTSLYFHTPLEKILGTICAIIPWILIYYDR